jgi:hypothetical protein
MSIFTTIDQLVHYYYHLWVRIQSQGIITLTIAELHYSRDDNDEESQQFSVREDVLHSRGPLHIPAVDERQNHCNRHQC